MQGETAENTPANSSSKPPTIAKRLWRVVKAVFYMLCKGISMRKLMLDLHLLLKRGKMSLHHHRPRAMNDAAGRPKEVEFSCSNTPIKWKGRQHKRSQEDYIAAVAEAWEFLNRSEISDAESAAPSPFAVRKVRITDSPFPFQEGGAARIDMQAEDFIKRFYEQLKRQQLDSASVTPDYWFV